MGEANITEIKTLNGYPLADTKAREDIAQLSEEIAVLGEEVDALKNEPTTSPFEVSGNIVRCKPSPGTALTVKTDADVTVYSCGKNLLGLSAGNTGKITKNGVTFTFEDDGSVTLNGTPSGNFYPVFWSGTGATVNNSSADYGLENMLKLPESGYCFSCTFTGSAEGKNNRPPSIRAYLADGTAYGFSGDTVFTAGQIQGINSITMGCYTDTTYTNYNIKYQLEVGGVATEYEKHTAIQSQQSDGTVYVSGLNGEYTVWASSGKVTVSGEMDNEEEQNDSIPFYWKTHLSSKIETIKTLHKTMGKDCFSFVAMADLHYPNNLGKRSPVLAKRIMEECGIPYLLCLGDMASTSAVAKKEDFLADNDRIEAMFEPIRNRTLFALGNHDGAYGTLDANGNGVIDENEQEMYVYNLTSAELHQWLYRKSCLIGGVYFDESGTAYYVDDTANRTRYIILNTQCNDYVLNENGTAKYNYMRKHCFTQKQYDFLTEEALVGLTDRWHVVVGAHIPLNAEGAAFGDKEVMLGLLTAFRNKTTYTKEYAGTAENGFDSVTINADFTSAKGNFVGYFAGHLHDGYHYTNASYGIDMIGIPADRQRTGMTAGTTTEQSFDVVTVDTVNKKIYCTKIGFGDDREISYA